MKKLEYMKNILRCPECHSSELSVKDSNMSCHSCGSLYPMSLERPVLLRADNEVFCQDDYRNAKVPALNQGIFNWTSLIPKSSVNLTSQRVLSRVQELLKKLPSASVLVVGGGHQRQWLDELLGSGEDIRVVYSDIDSSADVDLFCDGHDLLLVDKPAAMDGASCTYLFGCKIAGCIPDADIIARYVGAKHLRHT